MKGIRLSPVKKMAYAGVLLALNILLNRLLGMAQAGPLFSFARIAPGTSIVLFASVFLGPLYGVFVGVAGDALGWLFLGQWTGTFNFFLSIYYAIVGFLPFFVGRFFIIGKTKRVAHLLFPPFFGVMFLGAILAIWLAPGITTLFQKASLDMTAANIVFTVILVLGGSLTAVSYFLLCKKEDRMMGEFNLEATFGISFINEVLACFLKPLAFMAFYSLILGQSFTEATGFDYGALVAITAVFAMVNIPLNAYLLTLFCRRGQFLVRGSTYEKED